MSREEIPLIIRMWRCFTQPRKWIRAIKLSKKCKGGELCGPEFYAQSDAWDELLKVNK